MYLSAVAVLYISPFYSLSVHIFCGNIMIEDCLMDINLEHFFVRWWMQDGIPRTAYKFVVVFRWKGANRVFLTRANSLDALVEGNVTSEE